MLEGNLRAVKYLVWRGSQISYIINDNYFLVSFLMRVGMIEHVIRLKKNVKRGMKLVYI